MTVVVAAYSQCFQIKKSRSDVRRLVEQGSVQVNGIKFIVSKDAPRLKPGDVVRLDKMRAVRVG